MPRKEEADTIHKEGKFWDQMILKRDEREKKFMWDDPKISSICTGYYKKRLIELSSSKLGGRVVELACGVGWLSLELAKRGMYVDAYDIAKGRIEEAKKKLSEARQKGEITGNVNYQVEDLNTIVLPDKYYDFVVSHDGLHHIPEIRRLTEQIVKSLKKDGKIVVWDHIRHFGLLNKLVMGMVYLIFPTNMGYSEKVKWYFQILTGKDKGNKFPDTQLSPCEDSGMENIQELLLSNFKTIEVKQILSFVRPIVGRIRLPKWLLYPFVRILKFCDDIFVKCKLLKGEYIFFYGEHK